MEWVTSLVTSGHGREDPAARGPLLTAGPALTDKKSTAERFMELFQGYSGAHGTHGEPHREPDSLKWAIKKTASTLREPYTLEMWEQHLAGKRPLGIMPILSDGTCWWASIDFDEYDTNLLELVDRVHAMKLPVVPCRSKSNGLHLFLFFSTPQSAAVVQSVLRDLSAALGIAGSEIFPKQTAMLAERGDLGSWMVMPYYGDTFGGKLREQVGLKRTGSEMTAEEFLRYAEKMRIEDITTVAVTRPPVRAEKRGEKPKHEPFDDGPPCLQHLARTGVERGGQNNTLFMMGLYFRRKDPADWQSKLDEANQLFMRPPLSSDQVQQTIKSLSKKEYEYTCSVEPMASHCDSRACRRRRYGVSSSADYPDITALSVIDAEPAIWFVDVDGGRLEMSTEDLQRYDRFHRIAMERLHRCYMPMKHDTWTKIVASAMMNVDVVPMSGDVSMQARFTELLEEFCTNRQRGSRKEDIMVGKPWEDEDTGRHYFRLRDLHRYLERENFKNLTRGAMGEQIKKLGGEAMQLSIRGHNRHVWWVPVAALQTTPEVPVPPLPRREV